MSYLLSIIVPAYNVESTIRGTLDSIAKQSLKKNFETIVINDGSTDNTNMVIEEFIKSQDFLDIRLINKENGGVSSARNVGIKEAIGDYVLFLDGDDLLHEQCVESIALALRDKRPDILAYGYNRINTDGCVFTDYFKKNIFPMQDLPGEKTLIKIIRDSEFKIWTGSAVYKLALLKRYSLCYTDGCHSGEDTEFTYKALSHAKTVSFVPKTLSSYVIRKGSITNSYNIKKFQSIYAMKRVVKYINAQENIATQNLLNEAADEMVLNRFIANYNSCLAYKLNITSNNLKAMSILNQDLDIQYPQLRNEMKHTMKRYKGSNLKLILKIKIFSLSPLLYNKMVKIKVKNFN